VANFDIAYAWPLLGWCLLPVLAAFVYRFAGRVDRVWLRRFLRIPSAGLFLLSAPFAALMALVEADCSRHSPAIYSPDQTYLALRTYSDLGALGGVYLVEDGSGFAECETMVDGVQIDCKQTQTPLLPDPSGKGRR
jgi:hypothetical protein